MTKKLRIAGYGLIRNPQFKIPQSSQAGQTLIETILAIFILTTALTAGLGLAIYAMSVGTTSQSQIIAASLAREGVEVVRMIRDSNWLALDVSGNPNLQPNLCADIGNKFCYSDAFEQSPPVSGQGLLYLGQENIRLAFDVNSKSWSPQSAAGYNLYLQADGTYTHASNGNSQFARMVSLTKNTAAPYTNQNSNWELIVKSVVAWRGKNCPDFNSNTNLLTLSTPCKLIVEEHLTNWKDYR